MQDAGPRPSFGHAEAGDAAKKDGEYFVRLPDGRTQTVFYHANDTGYFARVVYTMSGGGEGAQRGSGERPRAASHLPKGLRKSLSSYPDAGSKLERARASSRVGKHSGYSRTKKKTPAGEFYKPVYLYPKIRVRPKSVPGSLTYPDSMSQTPVSSSLSRSFVSYPHYYSLPFAPSLFVSAYQGSEGVLPSPSLLSLNSSLSYSQSNVASHPFIRPYGARIPYVSPPVLSSPPSLSTAPHPTSAPYFSSTPYPPPVTYLPSLHPVVSSTPHPTSPSCAHHGVSSASFPSLSSTPRPPHLSPISRSYSLTTASPNKPYAQTTLAPIRRAYGLTTRSPARQDYTSFTRSPLHEAYAPTLLEKSDRAPSRPSSLKYTSSPRPFSYTTARPPRKSSFSTASPFPPYKAVSPTPQPPPKSYSVTPPPSKTTSPLKLPHKISSPPSPTSPTPPYLPPVSYLPPPPPPHHGPTPAPSYVSPTPPLYTATPSSSPYRPPPPPAPHLPRPPAHDALDNSVVPTAVPVVIPVDDRNPPVVGKRIALPLHRSLASHRKEVNKKRLAKARKYNHEDSHVLRELAEYDEAAEEYL
ncbi:uncharacterized protein [Penaeus vannamei]|uniref:uncharacterized protein n=1 Tax=Penaeus vannamei TaxID=6689 RepID=UPI00387F6D8E